MIAENVNFKHVPALAAMGYQEETIHEALNVPW